MGADIFISVLFDLTLLSLYWNLFSLCVSHYLAHSAIIWDLDCPSQETKDYVVVKSQHSCTWASDIVALFFFL